MLEILISSSVLIVVLAILRLALRDRISARLQYALWLLVLARLLVPVSFFHSPVSVAEAARPVTEQAEQFSGAFVFFRGAPVSAVYTTPEGEMLVIQDAEPNYASHRVLTLADAARWTWCAGMGVMAAWFLFVNLRLDRRLKRIRIPYEYNSCVPVYAAAEIPSPCLFGLIHPAIYLTQQAAEDPARARQIIAHELTHRRHGDTLWALLRCACLTVWWFNPLVWLAAALSRQDGELACDEGTIKALGEEARFDYGRTLVGMAHVGASPSDLLCGATTMTTGKRSLKERVERIAKAPKTSVLIAVIVLLLAAVAAGCAFAGAGDKTDAPEAEIAVEDELRETASGEASSSDALTAELEKQGELLTAFMSFCEPDAQAEVILSEGFRADGTAEPRSPVDYLLNASDWEFRHNGPQLANDPEAVIRIHGTDGRVLWIMDDADALMIEETDGSITWATKPGGVDCADMINHLLPWARGEYSAGQVLYPGQTAEDDPTREALALLGDWGLAEREPVQVYGSVSTTEYDSLSGTQMDFMLVGKTYGRPDSDGTVLTYERYRSDDPRAENLTADTFEDMRGLYPAIYKTFRAVAVNTQEAFAVEMDGRQVLWWYDAQRDLIFSLSIRTDASGEMEDALLGEMLALAESVG